MDHTNCLQVAIKTLQFNSTRQNLKNRASPTIIVCTFSIIRIATVSLIVFISTQTNVYTLFQHKQMYIHTGSRSKNVQNYLYTTTSSMWSSSGTISSRNILFFTYALSLPIVLFSTSFKLKSSHRKGTRLYTEADLPTIKSYLQSSLSSLEGRS
jgi:hypothetical protein